MIQGYVGHAKPTMDIDLILISRRRWLMGGTRYNARGIDDEGNTANFVESEQIVVKTKINQEKSTKRLQTYSYCQLRGSLPFYWS
jgi:SacI homology domain